MTVKFEVTYFLLNGHLNVIRVIDDVDYSYLNHESGKWVSDNSLFNAVTGAGGDASTREITLQEAQSWVKDNHPDLSVDFSDDGSVDWPDDFSDGNIPW